MQGNAGGVLTQSIPTAVTWQPNVRCCKCGSKVTKVTRTVTSEPGDTVRIRYHKCRRHNCKYCFKSIENIDD